MDQLFHILIIALGLSGIWLCLKIYREKKKETPLICPLGFNCDAVVKSKYGKVLGVPLEVSGLGYYSVIAIGHAILLIPTVAYGETIAFLLFVGAGLAFLASLFLTAIQAFVLKEWCSWCLVSAGITTLVFIASILLR